MEHAWLALDGAIRSLSAREALAYQGPGFLWVHLEGSNGDPAKFVHAAPNVPRVAAGALLATETRPRCDRIEEGAILNLRGEGEQETADSDRLVSIRLWVVDHRVISVSRHRLGALDSVRALMEKGAIRDAGDLVAAFARAISTELDPQVAALGDTLDSGESALEAGGLRRLRRTISEVRSEAISYRRFVAPDRDALRELAGMGFNWLADDDRLHIVEAADRFARMAEELEAVRERAALLHEQITDLRAEQVDQRALHIAIVAFVFLPLTFITGLLGMNVRGIPYANEPWAFWGVLLFCLLVGLLVAGWFLVGRWMRR